MCRSCMKYYNETKEVGIKNDNECQIQINWYLKSEIGSEIVVYLRAMSFLQE